jgi:multidrug resistance protein, MATE family
MSDMSGPLANPPRPPSESFDEFRRVCRIAWPVVLTYLGFMSMGFVDLLCVGRVSAAALGAVGIGTAVFSWLMVFGIGLLQGLDYLIAHAWGAGNPEDCHRTWIQGIWLSLGVGTPLIFCLLFIAQHLDALGIQAEVIPPARAYLSILSWSLPSIFLFTTCRQYLTAVGITKTALYVQIGANLLNLLVNWLLVFEHTWGHWNLPALGAAGSAYATLIARTFSFFAMFAFLWDWDRRNHRHILRIPIRLDLERMRKLTRLGLPSAFQMVFEVGAFATATTFAARLVPEALAAHQIVLNIASMTFMVPLGLSSATAVLVGQEVGRADVGAARRTGWHGLGLGLSFMALSSLTLLSLPSVILRCYTADVQVIAFASQILVIAAFFQISDGAQTVATGALRGLGDTRSPMLANLFGHWIVGLPLGVYLCFTKNWGISGLWSGLSTGLTLVAVILVFRWWRLSSRLLKGRSLQRIS